ncbi:MAG TPA: hypothetical protein VFT22_16890 [Kofleriaceae bacterium]|nr:hypothetical protein [Kofleriaceae bacterium]
MECAGLASTGPGSGSIRAIAEREVVGESNATGVVVDALVDLGTWLAGALNMTRVECALVFRRVLP